MQTRTVKAGQSELCTVIHEGHEFTALGSSTHGSSFTAYEARPLDQWRMRLTNWNGSRTILDSRCDRVASYRNQYGDDYFAVVLRVGHRFAVGYSMGTGMLFRGDMLGPDEDYDEAKYQAKEMARRCMDRDWEDSESFDDEDE